MPPNTALLFMIIWFENGVREQFSVSNISSNCSLTPLVDVFASDNLDLIKIVERVNLVAIL